MESNVIELGTKDSKGDTFMGSTGGNFDQSEMKKRRMIRLIIIIVAAILLITIIALILYFSLRSNDDKDKCETGPNEKCVICKKNSKDCAECNPFLD